MFIKLLTILSFEMRIASFLHPVYHYNVLFWDLDRVLNCSCRGKRGSIKKRDEENVSKKLTRDEDFQRIALKGKKYVR